MYEADILADFVWGGVVHLGGAGKPAAEIVKDALVNSGMSLICGMAPGWRERYRCYPGDEISEHRLLQNCSVLLGSI